MGAVVRANAALKLQILIIKLDQPQETKYKNMEHIMIFDDGN